MPRLKPLYFSILILAVTIAAGYFIYFRPGDFQPWKLGLDLIGGSHLVYEVDLSQVPKQDYQPVLNGLRDVIERRVNLFGVSEPQVYLTESGQARRLAVELAGVKDVKEAIKQIGLTPVLYFAEEIVAPRDGGARNDGGDVIASDSEAISFQPTELTGRYISGAQMTFDQLGQPQVSLSFNGDGAKIFGELTGRNVGKQLGVFLDGALITAPVVQEQIIGGQAQITGRFTADEARQLVERFNAGALPAPIKLISQQTVGASLGEDSLRKTIWAALIGTAALVLFMMAYYRFLGAIASLALWVYIILTMAVFKLFGITLTLAGIAGFVLSIGMAVDANILIFERTKEEIKRGLSKLAAIDEGFRRAWPSIRDSNVTTIITAVILYYFTSGFVKGFALALLIGVLVSMFSAITVTRTFLKTLTK